MLLIEFELIVSGNDCILLDVLCILYELALINVGMEMNKFLRNLRNLIYFSILRHKVMKNLNWSIFLFLPGNSDLKNMSKIFRLKTSLNNVTEGCFFFLV